MEDKEGDRQSQCALPFVSKLRQIEGMLQGYQGNGQQAILCGQESCGKCNWEITRQLVLTIILPLAYFAAYTTIFGINASIVHIKASYNQTQTNQLFESSK